MGTDLPQAGYLVWRRFAELNGDKAMMARLHILERAREAGCDLTVELPTGGQARVPEMIAAEAAVGALKIGDEQEWRRQWTSRLVEVAVKWQDEETTKDVVTVLNHTDAVIRDLKGAGVWPWGNEEASEQ
ncbi:MAG: hypothetical protein ACYS8K_04115 [Planctomycetota bacterium]|jgi:hypothetical protein